MGCGNSKENQVIKKNMDIVDIITSKIQMDSVNQKLKDDIESKTGKSLGYVMKNQPDVFIKKVFEHPYEKDKDGNPVVMDYATMRGMYG